MKNFLKTYIEFVKAPTFHRAELMSVQWLRGLAVMMVLVFHLEDLLRLTPSFTNFHSFWVQFGYSAPDLFFVISGFIMCYVTFGMKFERKHWLLSRFIRIYPMYMFFTFIAFCVWMIEPSMTMGSGPQTWSTVIQSFLIIPQAKLPLIFVGWTVEHEIVFYFLVFCVAAVGGGQRALLATMGTLSALAIIRWFIKDSVEWVNFWDFHFLSLYMVEFFMGAAIFSLKNALLRLGVLLPLILSVAIFIAGGFFATSATINEETLPRVLMFGSSYALLLVTVINWEVRERERKGEAYPPKKRPFLVVVGDASYTVYLVHPFCISVSGKLMNMMGFTGIGAILGVIATGLIIVFGGILFYNLVEKPFLQLMKVTVLSRRKKAPPPTEILKSNP